MGVFGAISVINLMNSSGKHGRRCHHCNCENCECVCHKDEEGSGWFILFAFAVIITMLLVAVGVIATLVDWMDSNQTLTHVIWGNLQWLWHLFGRII